MNEKEMKETECEEIEQMLIKDWQAEKAQKLIEDNQIYFK